MLVTGKPSGSVKGLGTRTHEMGEGRERGGPPFHAIRSRRSCLGRPTGGSDPLTRQRGKKAAR